MNNMFNEEVRVSRRKEVFKLLQSMLAEDETNAVLIMEPTDADRAYISQFSKKTGFRFKTRVGMKGDKVCMGVMLLDEEERSPGKSLEVEKDDEFTKKLFGNNKVPTPVAAPPKRMHSQRHEDWQRWASIIQEPASTRSPEDVAFMQYCRDHYQPGELHRD